MSADRGAAATPPRRVRPQAALEEVSRLRGVLASKDKRLSEAEDLAKAAVEARDEALADSRRRASSDPPVARRRTVAEEEDATVAAEAATAAALHERDIRIRDLETQVWGRAGSDRWVVGVPTRGAAAAATWIFRGDESRRRRGGDVDSAWRFVVAPPRLRRG